MGFPQFFVPLPATKLVSNIIHLPTGHFLGFPLLRFIGDTPSPFKPAQRSLHLARSEP